MTDLTLSAARALLEAALGDAAARKLKPVSIVVLDARGALLACLSQDGVSLMRWKIAMGKAQAALAMGLGSRAIGVMAVDRPHFVGAVAAMADEGFVPVAGGVLIRDAQRRIVGAVGVSGDTSDNDEAIAVAGVSAAGFTPDAG
ncbi:MAG: heme-binding protein [Methylobacteriaceae bacterium]|nr:heme-binding protein [Methylobacteriaceae bacterium]